MNWYENYYQKISPRDLLFTELKKLFPVPRNSLAHFGWKTKKERFLAQKLATFLIQKIINWSGQFCRCFWHIWFKSWRNFPEISFEVREMYGASFFNSVKSVRSRIWALVIFYPWTACRPCRQLPAVLRNILSIYRLHKLLLTKAACSRKHFLAPASLYFSYVSPFQEPPWNRGGGAFSSLVLPEKDTLQKYQEDSH